MDEMVGGRGSLEGEGDGVTRAASGGSPRSRPVTVGDEEEDNPRDPRDSGIGLPCEACGGEVCCCEGVGSAGEGGEGGREGEARMGSPDCEQEHHHLEDHVPQSPGRALPRLSLRTAGLAAAWHGLGSAEAGSSVGGSSGSGSGSGVGGRFSPESFKQRVLRAGLVGV